MPTNGPTCDNVPGTPRRELFVAETPFGHSGGQITVMNLIGGTNSSGTVTKTNASGWGNAGYSSAETITGDGWIQWTVTETTTDRMVGLSTTDANQHSNTIGYTFYMASGGGAQALQIYSNGSRVDPPGATLGPLTANTTVLKIERVGTDLKFYKDGTLQHTITGVTASPLLVDTSMYQQGSTIGPITMSP